MTFPQLQHSLRQLLAERIAAGRLTGLRLNWIVKAALILLLLAPALAQQKAEQVQPVWRTTWQAPDIEIHGKLTAAQIRALPDSVFAFPRVRREPLTDAAHVRTAIARFAQVKGVTDEERDLAFANIRKAAASFGVRVRETDWRQLVSARHSQ